MPSAVKRLRGGLALLALAASTCAWGAPDLAHATESPEGPTLKIVTEATDAEPISTFSMRVPLTGEAAMAMRRLRAAETGFSMQYRQALVEVLAATVLPVERAAQLAQDAIGLPRLELGGGVAELSVALHPFSLWQEKDGGRRLNLWSIEAPPDGRLVVVLRVPGDPLSARPLPDEDDGNGQLRWILPSESPAEISVSLREPLSAEDGHWAPRFASNFIAAGLPFAILLILLWGRRRTAYELFPLAVAGAALALAGATYYVYEGLATNWPSPDNRFASALLPALGTVPFVALAWRGRDRAFVLAALLSGAFAALVASHGSFAVQRPGDGSDVLRVVAAEAEYLVRDGDELIAACVVAILLATLVLASVVRWLARLRDRPDRPARSEKGPWRSRRALVAAAIGLAALGLVGQLILAARSSEDFDSLFNEEPPWSAALGSFLDSFPFLLANLSRNLALMLLGITLAAWLWRRAGAGEVAFQSWLECGALGLLFATAVTGVGGEIDGYAVPIPFLLSLAGATVGVRALARTRRGGRAAEGRAETVARSLLDDATEVALDRRRRHALNDRLVAGELDERAHRDAIRGLDERRKGLAAAKSLGAAAGTGWPREALALGLSTGIGARARFGELLRDGWPILLPPVAYTVYALVDLSAPHALSDAEPMGAAFLATALIDQALMWPLVAWCFVVAQPILPGHVGPLKGLWVGVFSALPFAVSSFALDDPLGREQWLFLSAELTLLLVVVGLFLDYRAVRRTGRDLRDLGELYNVTSARATLAYVAPLALLLFGVIRGLASGEGASALEELVSNASSLLPSGS
ncbi:MAG TPA: hypothetical protein VFY04_11875 [Solirubrobacterales bacterium]|nr:hypothetical protein [Solirubrobacterales bacterium]